MRAEAESLGAVRDHALEEHLALVVPVFETHDHVPVGEVAVGDEYLSSIYNIAALHLFRDGSDPAAADQERLLHVRARFRLGNDQVEQPRISLLLAFRHVAQHLVDDPDVEGGKYRGDAQIVYEYDMAQP